ncbi:MAG: hypothetical protein ACLP0A_10340 [Verrucomicrobiia bacterium]
MNLLTAAFLRRGQAGVELMKQGFVLLFRDYVPLLTDLVGQSDYQNPTATTTEPPIPTIPEFLLLN